MMSFFAKLKKDKVPYFAFLVLILLYLLIIFADFFALYPSVYSNKKNAYQPPISPLKRETPVSPRYDEVNYFSALNNPYGEPKTRYEQPKMEQYSYQQSVKPQREEPKIYLSAIEPNTLIHEYSDRFEVYDLNGGEKTLKTIVSKGE